MQGDEEADPAYTNNQCMDETERVCVSCVKTSGEHLVNAAAETTKVLIIGLLMKQIWELGTGLN